MHPGGDGSLLVAVGDVSGKGLKAAMTVSMIVGILRTLGEYEDDPANLLNGLNRRLFGRLYGGFATCIILKMTGSGECTLANAGHLSPFLNGHELPVEGSLPVGMIATTEYESQRFSFAAGDRLTMYTDGVLEASNPHGELFGFERLHALMTAKPSSASVAGMSSPPGNIQDHQCDDPGVLRLVASWSGRTVRCSSMQTRSWPARSPRAPGFRCGSPARAPFGRRPAVGRLAVWQCSATGRRQAYNGTAEDLDTWIRGYTSGAPSPPIASQPPASWQEQMMKSLPTLDIGARDAPDARAVSRV